MRFQTVEYSVSPAGLARLVLNRPDARNSISQQLRDEVGAAFRSAAEDDNVRALVLTGSDRFFCAGADIKEQRRQSEPERAQATQSFARWLQQIREFPKPLLGRINGGAYGGGLGLICLCDVAVGAEDARFSFSEVRIGVMPSLIAPYVVRRIGGARARALFLTAEVFDARHARDVGLLDVVVPAADLDAAMQHVCDMVLAGAPQALVGAKRLIDHMERHDEAERLAYSTDQAILMWSTQEAREGMDSFANSRAPAWVRRSAAP